jgi:manganese oxidase
MPKSRLSRRKLLAGAAPLVAAPALSKLAWDRTAGAAVETGHEGHMLAGAAMIGEDTPAAGGPHDLDALLYPPSVRAHQPGRVREYQLVAHDHEVEVAPGVFFAAWTYNGTVPGPVIRATEGDLLRVRFVNAGSHSSR